MVTVHTEAPATAGGAGRSRATYGPITGIHGG
jgi:hypothetical protein